jgi:hypothetical protein
VAAAAAIYRTAPGLQGLHMAAVSESKVKGIRSTSSSGTPRAARLSSARVPLFCVGCWLCHWSYTYTRPHTHTHTRAHARTHTRGGQLVSVYHGMEAVYGCLMRMLGEGKHRSVAIQDDYAWWARHDERCVREALSLLPQTRLSVPWVQWGGGADTQARASAVMTVAKSWSWRPAMRPCR